MVMSGGGVRVYVNVTNAVFSIIRFIVGQRKIERGGMVPTFTQNLSLCLGEKGYSSSFGCIIF